MFVTLLLGIGQFVSFHFCLPMARYRYPRDKPQFEQCCCWSGNKIQLWRKRSAKEAAKKAKQRWKRAQAKVKQKEEAGGNDTQAMSAASNALQASDVWESFAVYRAEAAIRGFDFVPGKRGKKVVCRLGVMSAKNAIEFIDVTKVCF